ncbi:MAG: carbohydrate-binding module family 50 [Lasallia pustulata]|uniref:Carbohydrate-binding module family 50 n=1 Tax=Lasallia pustulata TaxID=136370 RepID=A0A5M8Q1P3_9LECA|nr:MAG: carbohydrate-binding module family 50 [Lasallia pustulata]
MSTELPATANSATLRPRIRRLASVDDGAAAAGNAVPSSTQLEAFVPTSVFSRAASPIPSKHPSRSASSNRESQRPLSNAWPLGFNVAGPQASSSTFATGLWETSWSSLQGIASNLLGSDTLRTSKDNPNAALSPPRRRKVSEGFRSRQADAGPPAQWGPAGSTERYVGHGSREDRLAQVQAIRRERLLAANGHALPDSSGRLKRRGSDVRPSMSAPPAEREDRDALVYIHHVKPSDTLAGVMIKYNCQAPVFRKANRLWPNDSIQVKKTVILPVEACGVKGRKIAEPAESIDMLGDGAVGESTPTSSHATPWGDPAQDSSAKETPLSSIPTSPSIAASNGEEAPWKHDSWVMIDGHPAAVEIARIPCRALGYFPPGRRKSSSYSDLETPPASVDLLRVPYSDSSPRRDKSGSSGDYFVQQLKGPGGVGTLGREVHSPGPAQDGLNKLFAAHLPSVAPRASFESNTSNSSTGIENVGGAIEGWVRKLARKAAATVQPPAPSHRPGVRDSIELSDAFEVGEDDDGTLGADNGRLGQMGSGSSRDNQERLLTERFPPRGRVVEDRSRRKGYDGIDGVHVAKRANN